MPVPGDRPGVAGLPLRSRQLPWVFAVVLLLGCGGPPPSPQEEPTSAARETESGAEPAVQMTQAEIEKILAARNTPANELSIPPGPTGGTFRFNIDETPRSFDPAWIGDTASSFVGFCLHEGLIQFHPVDLSVKPNIATHWEISEDGRVYTFHLREGVFFHDNPCFPEGQGREVIAADFKYSFERVCDPRVASPGAWMFLGFIAGAQEYRDGVSARLEKARRASGGSIPEASSEDRFRRATEEQLAQWAAAPEEVSGIVCPDERTVEIHLAFPFSPFLLRLGHSFADVVPREAVEHYGNEFFRNPVGAGAFRFVEWIPGQRIVLEKHPNYWERDSAGNRLPYLDRIEISRISTKTSEHYELLGGNLHFQFELPIDLWDNIFTPELQPRPDYEHFQIQSEETWRIEYIGMNQEHPLFQNKKLRHAFNYAIDREEIAATVFRFRAIPNEGMIVPTSMPGYKSEQGPYKYDPWKASDLLAEAGYPGGQGLPELRLQLNAKGAENIQIAEIVQGYLAAIGVKVRLDVVDWRVHLDSVREGRIPFFRMGWLNDYPSPENSLMLLEGKSHPPEGENYSRFANQQFDDFYHQALRSTDPVEQNRLFREAEKVAVEEAPWMFLYFLRRFRLVAPEVRGFPMNSGDRRYLKYVWLDEKK